MVNYTETGYGIVLVTSNSQKEAEEIARCLIEANLAACVSITSIQSLYRWQGKVESDSEYQLTIKTDLALFENLSAKIQELHSYEVPEIIAIPIVKGSTTYLNWIKENTGD